MIDGLFKQGKSFALFPFRVYYTVQKESSGLQAGFGASAKKFKKAVDRNRIKRLMREGYRLNKPILEQVTVDNKYFISLFFIYTGKDLPTQELISTKVIASLNRIISILHEATTSNP